MFIANNDFEALILKNTLPIQKKFNRKTISIMR